MTSKRRPGRPLLFESVEELQKRIEDYFADCDPHPIEKKVIVIDPETGKSKVSKEWMLSEQKPYTITGLAVWLKTSRQTLLNYEMRPEFFDTITEAREKIEAFAEGCLYHKDFPTRGVIFSLTNNGQGWTEKTETDLNVKQDGASALASAMLGQDDSQEPDEGPKEGDA